MTGGARITFNQLARLTLPPFDTPTNVHPSHGAGALPASFCTAFSPSGSKFAVASQEGMVAVWDVRSRKPMKVFTTDRSRAPPGGAGGMARSGSRATGAASGWLYEDSWDWTMPGHKAPGWGVRNVKFNTGIGGKEVMTFTEVRRQRWLSCDEELIRSHSTHRCYTLSTRPRSSMKRSFVSLLSSPILHSHPHQDLPQPRHQHPPRLSQIPKHNLTYAPSPRAMMPGPSHPLLCRRACPTSPYRTCIHILIRMGTSITTLIVPHRLL